MQQHEDPAPLSAPPPRFISPEDAAAAAAALSRRQSIQLLRNRIEAVLWVMAAFATAYYGNGETDILDVVLNDTSVKRPWLYFGIAMMAVNIGIFLYLYLWLNCIQGVDAEWEEAAPLAIPIGTCCGVAAAFAFTVALWPVFSFLTAPILFVLFMGFLMSAHFWPQLGTFHKPKAAAPQPEAKAQGRKTL